MILCEPLMTSSFWKLYRHNGTTLLLGCMSQESHGSTLIPKVTRLV